MDTPWRMIAAADSNREYVVLLSYLPLCRYSKIRAFYRYTVQIRRQIGRASGAIGYGMRAKVLSRKFWTLSVWEDDRALTDFVRRTPHGEAMKLIARHMGATRFTRWKVPGSAVPPTWSEAMKRESKEN